MNTPLITPAASVALEAMADATAGVVAAEIAQAVALASLADEYRIDDGALMAGAERLLRGGAAGTPLVSEYLACEVGPLLGVSPASAALKIAEVLNLRHRHPRLWQACLTGKIRLWQAGAVASRVAQAGLDADAAEWVDRQMAAAARLQPWSRAVGSLEKLIVAADPALAQERAERAAATRRVEVGQIVDGHADLWGRLDAPDAIALDEALDAAADAMPQELGLPKSARRAVALGDLARGALGQQPLPVELIVHLPSPDAPAAEVDGHGVLLREQLADVLDGARVTVRPVLVVERGAQSGCGAHAAWAESGEGRDGYRVPDLMRRAVCERNPVDVFPFGTLPARRCDLDHTIPYVHTDPDHPATTAAQSQTRPANLGPVSRRAHRAKTHAGWRLTQPVPGVFEWESPAGYCYRVTAHGTTKVFPPPAHPNAPWASSDPPGLGESHHLHVRAEREAASAIGRHDDRVLTPRSPSVVAHPCHEPAERPPY